MKLQAVTLVLATLLLVSQEGVWAENRMKKGNGSQEGLECEGEREERKKNKEKTKTGGKSNRCREPRGNPPADAVTLRDREAKVVDELLRPKKPPPGLDAVKVLKKLNAISDSDRTPVDEDMLPMGKNDKLGNF